jgi:hypothetical protein
MNIGFALRRISLAASGLTFGTIALVGAAAPHAVARVYGLSLVGTDGLSEFRAIFLGFWISLCVAMVAAARRGAPPLLGDVCGLMVLLQALGRVWSVVADGPPSGRFVAALLAELFAGVCILAPRLAHARRGS